MEYAPLPSSTAAQRRDLRRSLGFLFAGVTRRDGILGDRTFRVKVLVVLNVLDIFTTAIVLAGGGQEGNPVMASVVEQWWQPILVKGAVLLVVALVARRCPVRSRLADGLLIGAWVFYGVVVTWNTVLITQM